MAVEAWKRAMTANVILCNQNLPLARLNQILEELPSPKVVCSTHAFFEREIQSLSEKAKVSTLFYSMADFFSDSELWDIDATALTQVKEKQPLAGKGGFERFRVAMMEVRSAWLNKKLRSQFGEINVWAVDGLGIYADYWERQSGKQIEIEVAQVTPRKLVGRLRKIFSRWKQSSYWNEIFFPNQPIVLLSRLSRISSKVNVECKPLPVWKKLVLLVLSQRIFPYSSRFSPACTLHEINRGHGSMLILQDGHYPSNYSSGHLWEYDDHQLFVPSNPFAEKWFENCGRHMKRLDGFCDPQMQKIKKLPTKITNVLFALNHAGDWSAMINRSDTCKLVQAVKAFAELNRHLRIRVRPHPTMAHPSHEGARSYRRIMDEVTSWRLDSVEISSEPLEVDVAFADVVVSEYSQVLIDAWASGKLGVIVNLTNRRSFMKDYEDFGFMSAYTVEALRKLLNENINTLVKRQNSAVELFNATLNEWGK